LTSPGTRRESTRIFLPPARLRITPLIVQIGPQGIPHHPSKRLNKVANEPTMARPGWPGAKNLDSNLTDKKPKFHSSIILSPTACCADPWIVECQVGMGDRCHPGHAFTKGQPTPLFLRLFHARLLVSDSLCPDFAKQRPYRLDLAVPPGTPSPNVGARFIAPKKKRTPNNARQSRTRFIAPPRFV